MCTIFIVRITALQAVLCAECCILVKLELHSVDAEVRIEYQAPWAIGDLQ